MRLHAILCVRDEGDVIAQSLAAALVWADAIHVYDTGSTDGTWETVRDLAAREARIVPLAREEVLFDCDTRGYVFERVRGGFEHGDWVCRMDADEFYAADPRAFLRDRVRPHEGRVCTQQYEFVMTAGELAAWERGQETLADRARPIQDRRRRFYVEPRAELRFFRYRRSMRWGRGHNLPFSPGVVALERIPVRHYNHRDPVQMERRCRLRATMARVTHHGPHWSIPDWRRWIVPDDDPRLMTWTPGTPLPDRRGTEHLFGPVKRAAQRAYYGLGLARVTDAFRPGWREGEMPAPIPTEVARELAGPSP
jgi:hypothetical protein